VHDVKVMIEEIDFPIRKLSENTSLYPIIGQTKTIELLLTGLKTKHNVTVLRHHIIQFFTRKMWRCNILFNFTNKDVFSVFSILVIRWQEPSETVKKKTLYHRFLT